MAESSNGYWVLDDDHMDGPQPRLREFVLPGIKRTLMLRDGSAGFLLVHLAVWFDEEVEVIDAGGTDDWGWSPRKISGTDEWSNHASGTAIDLNANKHPQGVDTDQTFSRKEINRIHNRLELYEGCIRWGGDYRTRPDAMHFEIDESLAPVVEKAQELVRTKYGRRICSENSGLFQLIV